MPPKEYFPMTLHKEGLHTSQGVSGFFSADSHFYLIKKQNSAICGLHANHLKLSGKKNAFKRPRVELH